MINSHPHLFTRLIPEEEKREEKFGGRDKKSSGFDGSQAVPARPSGKVK
jgi:hypothetical protein